MDGSLPVVVKTNQIWRSFAFGALVAASISVGAMAQSAAGQIGGGIPCSLASRGGEFTTPELTQIQNFVAAATANLVNQDTEVATGARDDLLGPLSCRDVSVSFRLEYGRQLNTHLNELIRPETPASVIVNALRVMGRVRSSESVRVLSTGLRDPRPVVRFGAAVGYRELLSKPPGEGWAINRGQQARALTDLQNGLANETNAVVLHGLVRALASVRDPALQVDAMTRLARGLSTRRAGIDPEKLTVEEIDAWIMAYARALNAVRGLIMNAAGQGNQGQLQREASIFAGQSLALVRDLMAHPSIEDDQAARDQLLSIVKLSEAVVLLAGPGLGQQPPQANLDRAYERGDPAVFARAISIWVGRQGLLCGPPYNARATDFE